MLTDPVEIEIISKAQQKNVRDPKRSRKHFDRIFDDFFGDVEFDGKVLLDLGPGQYDFAVLATGKGAVAHGVDKDEAVLELGRHKGFPVREGRLQALKAEDFAPLVFDGLFCKLSLNAFWFSNNDAQDQYIRELDQLVKEDGWGWIAPWNGSPKKQALSSKEIEEILMVQIDAFRECGFEYVELTARMSRHYGIHGVTANRPLFLRNLRLPDKLKSKSLK